jgi:hypothetical protein
MSVKKSAVNKNAPIHAAMRADEMLDKGDMMGKATWMLIIKAAEELLSEGKPESAKVH